jgi:hypothetical protein
VTAQFAARSRKKMLATVVDISSTNSSNQRLKCATRYIVFHSPDVIAALNIANSAAAGVRVIWERHQYLATAALAASVRICCIILLVLTMQFMAGCTDADFTGTDRDESKGPAGYLPEIAHSIIDYDVGSGLQRHPTLLLNLSARIH